MTWLNSQGAAVKLDYYNGTQYVTCGAITLGLSGYFVSAVIL